MNIEGTSLLILTIYFGYLSAYFHSSLISWTVHIEVWWGVRLYCSWGVLIGDPRTLVSLMSRYFVHVQG